LKGRDVARFRQLNLLSAAAVLRGQCSLKGPVDLWWARDNFIAAPDLGFFVTNQLVADVLAEKAQAVKQWREIETLARKIKFADAAQQEFVETSAAYGRIKYAVFEQAWTILFLGAQGDATKRYDQRRLASAIHAYDQLWNEWRDLAASHPSCATLYKEVAIGGKPGIGAMVDGYRRICGN